MTANLELWTRNSDLMAGITFVLGLLFGVTLSAVGVSLYAAANHPDKVAKSFTFLRDTFARK